MHIFFSEKANINSTIGQEICNENSFQFDYLLAHSILTAKRVFF